MGKPKYLFFEEKIPNFEFDYYYLFNYYIEFYKDSFFEKITLLSDTRSILYIDCWLPLELNIDKSQFSTKYFTENSYEGKPIDDIGMFEYFLSDERLLWKFYLMDFDDICIIGIKKEIKEKFELLFTPYNIISLPEQIEDVVTTTYPKTDWKQVWAKRQLKKIYNLESRV
jgi:hypothetical protein